MSKRDVSVQWLTGCSTVKEREDRKALVKGASPVLEVLLGILKREQQDLPLQREADYADSAWAFKQAHLNRRMEELDRLSTLLRSALTND